MSSPIDLNAIWLFTQIVRAGSISQAARLLQLPKSTVSLKLKQLEIQLGVSLLKRTTRKLSLTEAGQAYFQTCHRAMQTIQDANNYLSDYCKETTLRGILRISAPVEMGSSVFNKILSGFMEQYPAIQLEVFLTDKIVDLIEENIDLAIRIGVLKDSSLIAKKIGMTEFQLFAAPDYLSKSPKLESPYDLMQHQCLRFSSSLFQQPWKLYQAEQLIDLSIQATISVNNLLALKELTLLGRGISLLPRFLCHEEIERQQLVQVLSAWKTEPKPVQVVYPSQAFVPPKIKAFVDYLTTHIKVVF